MRCTNPRAELKLKKDVCGRGFSVGRFKKALKAALDADETEDEILLALAQLISGHSVCADLGRYFLRSVWCCRHTVSK